ncbi:MAG TPA: diguanylate cyclase [Burkholderiaceae bacterium]|jgi:diguanylate cyclase (GGDEF)-like protein
MDEIATRDTLTGALDRGSFAATMQQAMARAQEHKAALTLAIIDVDHFKSINDAFGHARGDEILREVTLRMQRTLRNGDKLFRYGGDEFVLILQDANLDQAQALIERLIHAVRDQKFDGSPPVSMTLSIGAASIEETGANLDALLARADARLYLSKRQGRNQLQTTDREELTASTAFSAEEQHGGRMLEREGALADIRGFLESLPARKRARLRIGGPFGSGRSRAIIEAGRHAALMGYTVLSLHGRAGYAMRMYAPILEARISGGPWSELPHPLRGTRRLVDELNALLAARNAAGLILLVDGADQIDQSTLTLLHEIVASSDIVQVGVIACADGALAHLLDCGVDTETTLLPLSMESARLWLRGMLKWEAPGAFVDEFHALCSGLPGLMRANLQRMRDLNLLAPNTEAWSINPEWKATLRAKPVGTDSKVRSWLAVGDELIGREQELAVIKQRLKVGGLLTLVAPGGMGKTHLALQAAAELATEFADGVHLVQLSGIESNELMLPAILQAIDLRLQGGVAPRRLLLNRTSKASMLLILDSFDSMLHDLSLVEDLVQASPNLRLLITAREPLQLPAERVLQISGLDSASPDAVHSAAQAQQLPGNAETMFLQHARKAFAEFVLADADAVHVSRICSAVGGMPLAIRLAAAWVTVFGCAEIAEKLEKDPQQANALSVINYFWAQLSESERSGASALAVCRGGFELAAAQKVAEVSPFFLSALVTKSFLVRNHSGRYNMQELLRQYSQRELSTHPQHWRKLRLVHGEYFLDLVEQSATHWHTTNEVFWFARIGGELDNLRAALSAAIDEGRTEHGLRMISALANFWIGRGLILEGLRWTQLVLNQKGIETLPNYAPAITAQGKLYFWSGQAEQSVRAFEAGLAAAQKIDSITTTAVCQAWLAASHFRRGRHDEALTLGQKALAIARDAAMPGEHALCLLTLGGVFLERGEQDNARESLLQCVRMLDEQGDGRRRTIALIFFGMLEYRDGHYINAIEKLNEAISFSRSNDDRLNYAFGLTHLAAVDTALGQYRDAQVKLAEAQEILHQAGAYDWEALCQVHSAHVHLATGDHEAMRAALNMALRCAIDSRSVRRQLLVIAAFAELAAAEGDGARAEDFARLALDHPEGGAEAAIPARRALNALGLKDKHCGMDDANASLREILRRLSHDITAPVQA